MGAPCPPKPNVYGPRGTVPAWADPTPVSVGTAVRETTFILPNDPVQILKPDPTRIAFFLGGSFNLGANVKVSPLPNPSDTGLEAGTSWDTAGITVFTHGALAQGAWWVFGFATTTVVVYELYRV